MFLITPSVASAQIFINEISPSTDPEWVELYATSDSNLQNCTLSFHDTEDTKQKIYFPDPVALPANSYFMVKKGERGWGSNWLNNSGDTVKLNCPTFSDSHTYSDSNGKTIGRSPDGNGNFFVLTTESPGAGNSPPTPSPTPTPTETPKTPSPTLTPVPTVLSVATKTLTPAPKFSPSPTSNIKSHTTKPSANPSHRSPTPSPLVTAEQKVLNKSTSQFSFILIGLGVVLSGAGAYPIAKKIYNGSHDEDAQIP